MSAIAIKIIAFAMQAGYAHSGNPRARGIATMIIAGPGQSKSETIAAIGHKLAKVLNRPIPTELIAMPQVTPEYLGGLPYPDNGVTHLWPMGPIKRLLEIGAGNIVLDEFTSSQEQTGAAALTLVQSRQAGDSVLPQTVSFIAMGNDPKRATNGRPLTSAESNRFVWVNWELSFDDWVDYINGGDGMLRHVNDEVILPMNWERNHAPRAAMYVREFLSKSPTCFNKEPADHDSSRAWPSPRSWEMCIRLMAAAFSTRHSMTSDMVHQVVQGCVGRDVALQFYTWMQKNNLVDPEEAVAAGSTFAFKDEDYNDTSRLMVCLEAIALAGVRRGPFNYVPGSTDENDAASQQEQARRWNRAAALVDSVEKSIALADTVAAPILAGGVPKALQLEWLKNKQAAKPKFLARFGKMSKDLRLDEIAHR